MSLSARKSPGLDSKVTQQEGDAHTRSIPALSNWSLAAAAAAEENEKKFPLLSFACRGISS